MSLNFCGEWESLRYLGLIFSLLTVIYTEVKILIADIFSVLQLFAVLFFIMLYAVGAGTAVALLAAVIYLICDHFPNVKYLLLAAVISVLGFVGGLLYVTPVSK